MSLADHSLTTLRPVPARLRLLGAAETILLDDGFYALSIRSICARAQTNVSQIRYYFGGMEGLLDALLQDALQTMSRAFEELERSGPANDLRTLVTALLDVVRTPACHAAHGFAANTIELIYSHASGAMRDRTTITLEHAHAPILAALAKHTPLLDKQDQHMRLTACFALAMSMFPGGTGRRLLTLRPVAGGWTEAGIDEALVDICTKLFSTR